MFTSEAADGDGIIRLSPSSVRLVTAGRDEAGRVVYRNYYPLGTVDDATVLYAKGIWQSTVTTEDDDYGKGKLAVWRHGAAESDDDSDSGDDSTDDD